MKNILLTKEASQMLRVSEEHVRELIRQKRIKAYKEGRRGGYRITMKEINRYIEDKHAEFNNSLEL